jgi:phosphopantetheine--protein transferase-like protein
VEIAVAIVVIPETWTGAALRRLVPATPEARFVSVSHTRGVSAVAWAPVRVGIDVEHVRDRKYLARLARRAMTDTEYDAWRAATEPGHAFAQHWTRVEAYLKATGTGVRGGLRARPPSSWTLADLDLGTVASDVVGAVAIAATEALIDQRVQVRGTSR